MTVERGVIQKLIDGLVESSGQTDPISAVRTRARLLIDSFVEVFGDPEEFPLDLLALASFLGIKIGSEAPLFSPDAELVPDGEGGVVMRVNPEQPETRRRFSIGHEITHTFFPDHKLHAWARADPRHRDLSRPEDRLEMLCDVGASELVLPFRYFVADSERVRNAADLVGLARRYRSSTEATLRRYAELNPEPVAAVFLSWGLKPVQLPRFGNSEQANLFGFDPTEEALAARRLRIVYAIPSVRFSELGHFIPKHKSVAHDGPVYVASTSGEPADGEVLLEFGGSTGRYRIHALPLWTPAEDRGPGGEFAVGAIIRPMDPPRRRTNRDTISRSLFE